MNISRFCHKITFIFLLLLSCVSYNQAQNTKQKTPKLNLNDLLRLADIKDVDDVDRFLTNRGWRFDGNEIDDEYEESPFDEEYQLNIERYSRTSWSFEKDRYSDMAQAFFSFNKLVTMPDDYVMNDNKLWSVFRHKDGSSTHITLSCISWIYYQMANDEHYRSLEKELNAKGFKKVKPAETIEDGLLICYQKDPYKVYIAKTKTNEKKGADIFYQLEIFNYKEIEKLFAEKQKEKEKLFAEEQKKIERNAQLSLEELLDMQKNNISYLEDYLEGKNWDKNDYCYGDTAWIGYDYHIFDNDITTKQYYGDKCAKVVFGQYNPDSHDGLSKFFEYKDLDNSIIYYPYSKEAPHYKQYDVVKTTIEKSSSYKLHYSQTKEDTKDNIYYYRNGDTEIILNDNKHSIEIYNYEQRSMLREYTPPPYDSIQGDFDGNGTLEYLYITKLPYDICYAFPAISDTFYFSDPHIPAFVFSLPDAFWNNDLSNYGDLNKNGTDEIGCVVFGTESQWIVLYIYTLTDTGWVEAVPNIPRPRFFYEGSDTINVPIVVDENKEGHVIVSNIISDVSDGLVEIIESIPIVTYKETAFLLRKKIDSLFITYNKQLLDNPFNVYRKQLSNDDKGIISNYNDDRKKEYELAVKTTNDNFLRLKQEIETTYKQEREVLYQQYMAYYPSKNIFENRYDSIGKTAMKAESQYLKEITDFKNNYQNNISSARLRKGGKTEKDKEILSAIKQLKDASSYPEIIRFVIENNKRLSKVYTKEGSYFISQQEFYESYISENYKHILKTKKIK